MKLGTVAGSVSLSHILLSGSFVCELFANFHQVGSGEGIYFNKLQLFGYKSRSLQYLEINQLSPHIHQFMGIG